MDLNLRDRVYLITGGSGGLGRATAEALVAEGARVLISGRSEESLRATAEALGENASWMVADNADEHSAQRLVDAAQERFGRLDGVLVSVGGPTPGTALESSEAAWRSAFDSVFLGALRLARVSSEAMADGGAIAFVLSTSVKSPLPGLAISNGLRPGLAMVAKDLSVELGPRNIRVNALMPGRIATERVAQLDAATGDAVASRAGHEARIPLGRYGEPEEFGRVAAFLLSPAASFVNGAMVPVDGGALQVL